MPSFAELMDLRLGKLKLAVDDWSALITKLADLEGDANTLDDKARQATWRGENAKVSKAFVTKTAKEFRDAFTEATSIRNILRDLHRQLTSAQSQLKALVEEAPSQGLHIDAKGTVSAASTQTNSVERENTPFTSISVPKDRRGDIEAMVRRIEKILQAAEEDDRTATGALGLLGNEAHNFSDVRYRDLNAAERHQIADAKKAVELAQQGADLTDRQLTSLNTLLRTHQGDTRFGEEFATRLGARGTLEFWAGVVDPPHYMHTAERTKLLAALQNNLGHTLGSATESDAPDMKAWEKDVIELGDQRLGIDAAQNPYGFQVMSSLMRQGEYDSDFLGRYGDELVSFERTQKSETGRDPSVLWSRNARLFRLNLGDENDYGLDPMVGFMEALGHSPGGSTAFFADDSPLDSTSKGDAVTNFSYLTEERTWPPGRDSDQPSPGHTSLGHALVSATLGHPYDEPGPQAPDPRGEAEQAGVMKQVVDFYGANPETLEEQEGIRESLTTIAIGGIDDLNYSLDNFGGSADAAGRDRLTWTADGEPHDLGRHESKNFLRTLAADENSYERISAAQQIYMASGLEANRSEMKDALSFATKAAEIHGILDQTREDEIVRQYGEETEETGRMLEKMGEWRKYVVNATLAAAAGSVAGMMGPGAGVAAATLVPLAVDFGSAAAQTHYATEVMDQIDAEGEGDRGGVVENLDKDLSDGEQRLMAPVNKFMDANDISEETREAFPERMSGIYGRGRGFVENRVPY